MEGDNANNWHIMSLCLFRNRGLKKKKPQMNTNYNETQVDVDTSTLTWYIKCDRYAIQKNHTRKTSRRLDVLYQLVEELIRKRLNSTSLPRTSTLKIQEIYTILKLNVQ